MDPELLSRIQFALTVSFHFIFPPISMGLGLLLVVMGVRLPADEGPDLAPGVVLLGQDLRPRLRDGHRHRHRPGVRVRDELGRLLALRRATSSAACSRPKASSPSCSKAASSACMLFGGTPARARACGCGATFLVVFGAHFSALWILMANSWMQTPQGYEIARPTQWGDAGVHDRLRAGRRSRRRSCRACCTPGSRRGWSARRW